MATKSKPIGTFNIFLKIPIKVSLSGTDEDKERLERIINKKQIDKSIYLNQILLRRLRRNGISGYIQILKNQDIDKLLKKDFMDDFYGFLGTSNISKCVFEEIKEDDKSN